MRALRFARCAWIWTLLAPLPLCASDVKIVTEHKLPGGSPPFTDTRYVKGQRIRTEWRNSHGVAKRAGVVIRGKWFPETRLQEMLNELAVSYAKPKK